MAAVMAFTPGAALAHHHYYEPPDNTGNAAIILGGALVLGGILINSQERNDDYYYRPYRRDYYRVEPTYVVETYWRHGRRYRICRQGRKEFYCWSML